MARRNALRDRYRRVMDRLGEAAEKSGRTASSVYCVAVTKTATPAQIRQLMEAGHQDFGENRVQQLLQRIGMTDEVLSRQQLMGPGRGGAIDETIRWHMIGHLQRNKVKPLIGHVKLIHSVDSMRLAEELETQAAKRECDAEVLLQVNTADEASKYGLALASVPHMVEQLMSMLHVKVRGLMMMAPRADDPQTLRPLFERTAEQFHDMKTSGRCGDQFNVLSMGMSDDYEVAVACGANLVRLGRAIFGEAGDQSAGAA